MDREAAVLRAEMSRTREDLDRKIALLQARVSDMSPQRLSERYVPEYLLDRVIGGVLTMIGLRMAWSQYRSYRHRDHLRAELAAYCRW